MGGIAASTSISLAVSFGLLLALLHRRERLLDLDRFLSGTGRVLLVFAGLAMHLCRDLLSSDDRLVALLVPGLAGLVAYVPLVRMLAPAETTEFVAGVRAALAGIGGDRR